MRGTFVSLGIAAAIAVVFFFAFLVYVLLASGDADYWAGEIAEFGRRWRLSIGVLAAPTWII